MAYSTAEARQQLLDTVASATDDLGLALAALGAAYEELDEHRADELEASLFRPVQAAYALAQRTHAQFAARHRLPGRAFGAASPGAASSGARGFIERAVEAAEHADATLAELQDSLAPVEVGDAELRAGLSGVRERLDGLSHRARELVRTVGR